jgi:hypothetical protein
MTKNEEKMIPKSKSERNTQWILKRMHEHDEDTGGIFTLTTGSQGSAKTSVMLSFVNYTINHYPNEKVFWSSCYEAPLQYTKLKPKYINVMVQSGTNIVFLDRKNKLKDITQNIKITYFTDFDDLFKKAKCGKVNAIFFADRLKWMDFIHYLRRVGEWTHIFIDELSEICPAFTAGDTWKAIGEFSINAKEIRKCLMNVHCNTQAVQDIDHRVLTKVMVKIFMPGSQKTKHSRILQQAIDNLKEDRIKGNEGYLEYSGKFGKCQFREIFKPTNISWQANVIQ